MSLWSLSTRIERPDQTRSLGRELAELVDEWIVTRRRQGSKIASEMIGKARETLRATHCQNS